jgi:hypothetical protein
MSSTRTGRAPVARYFDSRLEATYSSGGFAGGWLQMQETWLGIPIFACLLPRMLVVLLCPLLGMGLYSLVDRRTAAALDQSFVMLCAVLLTGVALFLYWFILVLSRLEAFSAGVVGIIGAYYFMPPSILNERTIWVFFAVAWVLAACGTRLVHARQKR